MYTFWIHVNASVLITFHYALVFCETTIPSGLQILPMLIVHSFWENPVCYYQVNRERKSQYTQHVWKRLPIPFSNSCCMMLPVNEKWKSVRCSCRCSGRCYLCSKTSTMLIFHKERRRGSTFQQPIKLIQCDIFLKSNSIK